jgi:hypothetical protein
VRYEPASGNWRDDFNRPERYRARAAFAQDLKRFIERIDINEAFADVIPHGGEGIALVLDPVEFVKQYGGPHPQ